MRFDVFNQPVNSSPLARVNANAAHRLQQWCRCGSGFQNVGKGLIYSNFLVPEDTDRTLELRNWLKMQDDRPNVRVVVSHDLEDIVDSGLESF